MAVSSYKKQLPLSLAILLPHSILDHSTKTTLGMAGGVTVLANPGSVRATPANDRLVLAMIGINSRGNSLAMGFLDRDDCDIG